MLTARIKAHLVGVGVCLVTACLMIVTEPSFSIVWDEGFTLGREESLRDWFEALRDPARFAATWQRRPLDDELVQRPPGTPPPRPEQMDTRRKLLFDSDVLAWFWPFAREEPHGHPPFYALLGLIGDFAAPTWQELPRARLGPMLLFSLTAGAIFSFVSTRWGYWPAALACGSWVLQPNLFGHGHYAAYDAVLSSLWVLSIVVFIWAVDPATDRSGKGNRWPAIVTFGAILGCAAGTKLTGWFLPLPFLAWAILYRSRQGFLTLAAGAMIAAIVLFMFMPPWWNEPVVGLFRFLDSNLNRARSILINIEFLGRTYVTPKQSLPWYNTLVWTLMVTPVGFLMLAALGVWSAVQRLATGIVRRLARRSLVFFDATAGHAARARARRCAAFSAGFWGACSPGRPGGQGLVRVVGPMGQGGDRGRSGRGCCKSCGDDAGAALVLQPGCGRASRARPVWVWSRPITGTRSARRPGSG